MIYNILVILVIAFSLQLAGIIKSREYNLRFFYRRFFSFVKADLQMFKDWDKAGIHSLLNLVRALSYYSSIVLFLLMALSGFLPFVFMGTILSGFALLIHVTAAPLFCVAYSIFILLSAYNYKFDKTDYRFVFKSDTIEDSGKYEYVKDGIILKTVFWMAAAVSIPVILSIILSLYPIFTSEEMESLIDLHGYSVLIFTILFVIQVYYSIILRTQEKNHSS